MGRRYYSRRYYSRRRSYSTSNGGLVTALIYILFLPFILIYLLIKLIIKLSKKNNSAPQEEFVSEANPYQEEPPQVTYYDDEVDDNETEQTTYQQKDSLITDYEKYFYNILEETFGNEYKIQTQVNLASIVKKVDNSKYQNELFRNIDFGIFEKSTLKPLLMIEINDSTHKNSNRYQRDLNVRKILEESDIKLITFYSSYQNKRDYVIDRITKELNDK